MMGGALDKKAADYFFESKGGVTRTIFLHGPCETEATGVTFVVVVL